MSGDALSKNPKIPKSPLSVHLPKNISHPRCKYLPLRALSGALSNNSLYCYEEWDMKDIFI